ncbi:MAG TPA: DNA polymerase ligase N-terminal domain-containing protein [Mycobacteriales bacterium]|nr:DNA polymerase ligase N-terminal domain-containing protein [Mycobacteriales bacterium]
MPALRGQRRRAESADAPGSLSTYRKKRVFTATPEPAGAAPRKRKGPGGRFVVQRHRARALHYDFRLEMGGVLVSWAVPKGPTLDPKARRQAIHVEDHPVEYFPFEGVIPKGLYGGGDVIVWDWGRWKPAKDVDPVQAVADGELHFDLEGERLKGRFVLVRTGERGGKEKWLLLHKNDDFAVAGWDAESFAASVKSGRTNDEVARAPSSRWRSDLPSAEAEQSLVPAVPSWDPPSEDELVSLDALGKEGTWEVQGQALRLTNLDKPLFPARKGEDPVTKRDLIRYAARVGPWLLPYLWDRPVNLHRYPNGVDKPGFWHKEVPSHAPDWLTRWHNEDADPDETQWYVVADSVPALAWLANFGAIELNPWTSSVRDTHEPTWALIDVDPGTRTSWDELLVLARLYRTALDHLGVVAQPKVTGKRGIQVWVPIAGGCSFEQTREWVEGISRAIGQTVPELVAWEWTKADRKGLARLDYTQNAINKTLVAPFSPRPGAGAPVSVPIEWDELDDEALRPDRWTIRTVFDRLATHGDPLRRLVGVQQHLPSL